MDAKTPPLNWKNAQAGCIGRFRIIEKLLREHPELVTWLFKDDAPEMFASAEVVKARAGAFSSGQLIMIKLALDIWFNGTHSNVFDIARRLDGENFVAAMEAIVEFRKL